MSVEALAQAISGELSRARGLLEVLDGSDHPARLPVANIERSRGWLAFRPQGRAVATEIFTATVRSALSSGNVSSALLTACDLARIGDAGASLAVMGEKPPNPDGLLFPALWRSISARADGSWKALDEAAGQLATIGRPHLAAELHEEANLVAPNDSAATRRMARIRELRLLTDCRPLAELLPAELNGLTKRESEVARLAATGATSKEIGKRLFIATRTVDTHLQRVYHEVGIGSRAELVATLTQ